jgi:putative flavoprotein involved in K+ transport
MKIEVDDSVQSYESALELNIWNKTQLVESRWDAIKKSWTVVVEREVNGSSVRSKYQNHLVVMTC